MAVFEVTFSDPHRQREIVRADAMRRTRGGVVFEDVRIVILSPRWILVRRYAASEVAVVRRLEGREDTMVNADGYRVERILIQKSLRRPPRPFLRVTRHSRWIADCRSPAEVARYVDLRSLRDE